MTEVIESPLLAPCEPDYVALVSGGSDSDKHSVALVDAADGKELARWSGQQQNIFDSIPFNTGGLLGCKARLRVVDRSTGGWGHINFGGLYAAPKPRIAK